LNLAPLSKREYRTQVTFHAGPSMTDKVLKVLGALQQVVMRVTFNFSHITCILTHDSGRQVFQIFDSAHANLAFRVKGRLTG
jgi:hypothetical protein